MTIIGNVPWNKTEMDEAWLVEQYRERRMSVKSLAAHYGVTIWAIYRRLRVLGVDRRSNSDAHKGLAIGHNNPNWNGGRWQMTSGYVGVRTGPGTTKREHQVVAEQKILGRALMPGEVVHHINGNKSDNRPENLQVFSSHSEHMRHHMLQGNTAQERGHKGGWARCAALAAGAGAEQP